MRSSPFAIRPLALHIENFRGLGGVHELRFESSATLVLGKNGSGKSSLLNAIEWCLFGAEATNKSKSGIDERGEWVLAHFGAQGMVSVTLELEVEGGRARLTREREQGASSREAGRVRLELPGDELLEGAEVLEWLEWNDLPDWKTWKRSFCQHQEQSRARVTETADRSAAIAGMLGLEEFREVTSKLKALKADKLEKRAALELSVLADEQRRALERPSLELRELEAKLEQLGIPIPRAGGGDPKGLVERMLCGARALPPEFDLSEQVPGDGVSRDDLQRWAQAWPSLVQVTLSSLHKQHGELLGRERALAAAHQSLEPARRSWADAESLLKRLLTELGTREELEARRRTLKQELADLRAKQRAEDARGQLLRDALEIIEASSGADQCPVCDQPVDDRWRRLRELVENRQSDAAQDRFGQLSAREAKLRQSEEQIAQAEQALESKESQLASLEQQLRTQLPPDADEGSEVAKLLESWRQRAKGLEANLLSTEAYLQEHRRSCEGLELLAKLSAARARANARAGEVSEAPEFHDLQEAIDQAAGLACDLEALGAMARALEDEQSSRQIARVNESIDGYFSLVTGQAQRGTVHVKVKKTAAKVTYQLVDGAGRTITSLLNQASFNALSLAALFASAEGRASEGRPQFLVLDDPGQSLDSEHQVGLARAIAKVAGRLPVIVATYPGALAEALAHEGLPGLRTYSLTRIDDNTGTLIEEVGS